MADSERTRITVETVVSATPERVWDCWTHPEHIVCWNQASADWHTTRAENDLRAGGKFLSRMEAKDGSAGFDFWGIYDAVESKKLLASTLGDSRKVIVSFEAVEGGTRIVETFEAEDQNSVELQRFGWQSILDSFKSFVETAE
ncbi:MAG: SRPBCC domain-containing protein [Clostridiaceae bacterium]